MVNQTRVWHLCRWLSIGLILINLMSGMSVAASQNSSPSPDIRSTIELARTAWIARDADALSQLFTADGILIVPGQRWQGRDRIRSEIAKFARDYTDVSITIHRIIIDGDKAAVEWHYEDTERATGKRNRADDAIVIEVENGQISYWREYFDTAGN